MPRLTVRERERFIDLCNESVDKMEAPRNARKEHWLNLPMAELLSLLEVEVLELKHAMKYSHAADVVSECCDVTNFALMIMDHADRKSAGLQKETGF